IVAPANLSGLILDCAKHAFAPDAVVRARPPVRTMLGLGEIDAIRIVRAADQEPCRRIKARRSIVGATRLVRRNETSVARRLLRGIGHGPPILVHAFSLI